MSIQPDQVTACLVTRGNVDLQPILDSLIFPNVIVWDNRERVDMSVYGRYAAAQAAPTDVVYFQDDDAIIPPETQQAMCDTYVDGLLNANMEEARHGQGWAWLGWGTLVQRDLTMQAFDHWGGDRVSPRFLNVGCDILTGLLVPHRLTSLPFRHLDYAFGGDRLYQQPDHTRWKDQMLTEARALPPLPLRLNLGCGTVRLPGFVNLDPLTGWRYQDGLPYDDGRVEAITISHSLMYLPAEEWPAAFKEFHRVLRPGGILRITEDATDDPDSERYGGHTDAVTLTSHSLVGGHMLAAGLAINYGEFRDLTLIQRWHGDPPKVFHVEAIKA